MKLGKDHPFHKQPPRKLPTTGSKSDAVRRVLCQAVVHHRAGRLDEAQSEYEEVLRLSPANADALHLLGLVAHQKADHAIALVLMERSLASNPNNAEAFNNRGNVLRALGRTQAARESYERALALKSDYAEAFCNLGDVLHDLGQHSAAVSSYDKAVVLRADWAQPYNGRGRSLRALGDYDAASKSFEKAITLKPGYAEAHNNRGNLLQDLQQYLAAVESYDEALRHAPGYAQAYNNRGIALQRLGRSQEAADSYDRAVALAPRYAEAHSNRANALQELRQYEAALAAYDTALRLRPGVAETYSSRGDTLQALGRYDEAVQSYDRAVALKPDIAEAHNNRGNALQKLRDYTAAVESYARAIAVKPDYAAAYANRAAALLCLKEHAAALDSCDAAIALNSTCAEAYATRGMVLEQIKQYEAAIESYSRTLLLDANREYVHGRRLFAMMKVADWSEYDEACLRLQNGITNDEAIALPWDVLTLIDSPALQRNAAELYARRKLPTSPGTGSMAIRQRRDRIHVGYFSADFYGHATSYLMAELLELHDRERFDFTAFSFGPQLQDEMAQRIRSAVERFIDVRTMSNADVAQMSRELGIDIAVDLKGFTHENRAGIFAQRAAPVQVSYLGYPGTMGATYMDYLIADRTLIPEHNRQHYTEHVVYLPNSYQVNDRHRPIADTPCEREDENLPDSGFVYCCFNNTFKITPLMFDIWMRVLQRVSGSVLWLLGDNACAIGNLRAAAAQRGVDPERLIFAERKPLPEHLARHRMADLFLDTLPCNAHTTASDALWAGLPVLTLMGEAFAARVSASLLRAIDLPELIAPTQEEYERIAIDFGSSPELCNIMKDRLRRNRLTTSLFDTQLYTQHLERAYSAMYEKYQAHMPPEDIVIEV